MLQQYFQAKEEHPGVLLAMRVGDFYEFYGEDAVTASQVLEITLTGREDGSNGRIPMAGVPYHSVEKYIARLIAAGHKVALCDQIEDPKLAKGLVQRKVTRVLTQGTIVEDSMLPGSSNNFLAAICVVDGHAGIATLDSSTGEFMVTELRGEQLRDRLLQELARIRPSELLVPDTSADVGDQARTLLGTATTAADPPRIDRATRSLLEHFDVANLAGYGCADKPSAIVAASMVLGYASRNGLNLRHVDTLATYSVDGFLLLDPATRRSLELTQNLTDGSRRFTLLSILDQTVTSMGSRLLRRWIETPLIDLPAIHSRQESIGRMADQLMNRADLRTGLERVADLERLVSRCATGIAGPRDLAALKGTLVAIRDLRPAILKFAWGRVQELREQIADHGDLEAVLTKAVVDDPPHSIRDGGVIKPGYDTELDKLRSLSSSGKQYIIDLEKTERSATGISSLKVGFNSVFGYYLEVPKAHIDKVPATYIRKQTTANGERYITAELKDHESAVLGAEEKAVALEADLFARLRNRVADQSSKLLRSSRALAEIDALSALAEVAVRNRFVCPDVIDGHGIEMAAGRHPVVEASQASFVPNDLTLGGEGRPHLAILTGPNMSGKSTYLRQAALITLMAQIGSFVPAASAKIAVCDRIFARIGAKDELALGQSTFMVEMVESANILNHATDRSLVILDEIGRGTSTFDGLAIAWAMAEDLADRGVKTLFATHYHQLNALAEQVEGVTNLRVSVEEIGDDIIWTHRVLQGGTDRSYGIHVARMAGLPGRVLQRAKAILADLESDERAPRANVQHRSLQLTLFDGEEPEIVKALRGLSIDAMTPIQALQTLDAWKAKFAKDDED
ncbi:MAG: DNA mismatch repair protein MutS [Fimbriimonadaceae bacterium]|nr:DNA mismatch repair protein MutS [Fimbriimonadaceae bacterium]